MNNPFKKATQEKRNIKLLLYGDSGVGKTTLALKFPRPCVVDLEGGTKLYGKKFDFAVLRPDDSKGVDEAINFLMRGGAAEYDTVIIDPITVYWEMIQRKWNDIFLRRNQKSPGNKHEFYELQMRDWSTIKSDWRECIQNLISLPLNVVAVAREKAQYSGSGFMQKIGDTFDAEKNMHYPFDTVVRIAWANGKRTCFVSKDRSETLSPEFELSFDPFAQILANQVPQEKVPVEVDEASSPDSKETGDWLDQPVGFKKTGNLTWRELGKNALLPDGSKGRVYLRKLSAWKDNQEIADKASQALICDGQPVDNQEPIIDQDDIPF